MKNKDNVKQIDGNKEEEKDKKDTRRILRLEARVTEDEYAKAAELAQSCGLTMSDFLFQLIHFDANIIHTNKDNIKNNTLSTCVHVHIDGNRKKKCSTNRMEVQMPEIM